MISMCMFLNGLMLVCVCPYLDGWVQVSVLRENDNILARVNEREREREREREEREIDYFQIFQFHVTKVEDDDNDWCFMATFVFKQKSGKSS